MSRLLWILVFFLIQTASFAGPPDTATLKDFAAKYAAAWCSQNAAAVASFFEENGSLKINDGNPSIGRTAIAAAAQSFMSAFPDMVVKMDDLSIEGTHPLFHWTLTGTNTGPNGTWNFVRISGYEEWTIGADGLIAQSLGHFDEADYRKQLGVGNKIRDAVETTTAAFHQALRTDNADEMFRYVAEDVVMMPPGEGEVRGKAAMRAWYEGFLKQFSTDSLTLTDREVLVGNRWAVEKGAYEWVLKPTAGGELLPDRGHYMQIWKLDANGNWLFIREIWNSSIPPAK